MTKYVSSRVVLDKSAIANLTASAVIALEKTGDFVLGDVVEKQVMPFDTGFMQNESTYVNKSQSKQGKVSVVTSTPYARRLYFHPEYNFRKDNNPNAKGKWLQDWTEEGKYADRIKKAYAKFLKELGGL